MKYRPEVDGLRTLAVIPVVLFHAGFQRFSGGYAGVDIFFVISGFLITTILISELERGDFSIARFYERRARRILPALFFVMALCIPAAWVWLLPPDFEEFSASALSVVFFVSNIFFWMQSGYFDGAAELKPLLHTWSLAVEEQYYLIFPLLLWALWRFGRRNVFAAVIGLAALSFVFSLWQIRHDPEGNFYLAPSRAWELLAGSVCALVLSRKPLPGNDIAGLAGIGMILVAIFAFDARTPWPGPWTLLPVVGTMLVILFARQGTLAARLLSLRPMVWIGLISYSLYLWHQPVFAFGRIAFDVPQASKRMLLLAGLSAGLAWFSWRFVERPFRKGAQYPLPTRAAVFRAGALGGMVFAAFGLFGISSGGAAMRYPAGLSTLLAAGDDTSRNPCKVEMRDSLPVHPVPACLVTSGQKAPHVILAGDSHAWAVSDEVGRALRAAGVDYYVMSHSACIPVPGIYRLDLKPVDRCPAFFDGLFRYAREQGVKTIILSGRFTANLTMTYYDNGEGGVEGLTWMEDRVVADSVYDAANPAVPPEDIRRARVAEAFRDRLTALSQEFNLVIIEPIPEAGWNVPKEAMQRALKTGRVEDLSTSRARYLDRNAETLALLRELPAEHVRLVRSVDVFCPEDTGRCRNMIDGVPLYSDDDHLTNTGARLLAPGVVEAVRGW
ncbi:acyltransferase [Sinirhodobacter populi]|uniref:Acyltransferase n=1 Tax=Paenirhodobacter populi TaxID=2306993 RepID=A0A443KAM5_9RHOB|nr:acyltransferase family protein [Sinirhodobacter populi]RWR29818.1 acyltransferase [Sinirhodobacter populi]